MWRMLWLVLVHTSLGFAATVVVAGDAWLEFSGPIDNLMW